MWEANSITQKPQKLGHLKIASKMTILKGANSDTTKIEEFGYDRTSVQHRDGH